MLYVFSRPEFCAVVLPILICALFAAKGTLRGLNASLLAIFILTTLIDVLLAQWRLLPNGTLELSAKPVCAIALLVLPVIPARGSLRPSPYLGYCLVFFSELATDLACGLQYAIEHHCLSTQFFRGIGGAGFADGLFIYPLITSIGLALLQVLPRIEAWIAVRLNFLRT